MTIKKMQALSTQEARVIKEIYNKKYTNIEDDIKKFNNKKYQKQKKYEILGIDERDKTEFNKEFDIFKFEDSYDQTDSDSYGFD
jgi:glycogen synthase